MGKMIKNSEVCIILEISSGCGWRNVGKKMGSAASTLKTKKLINQIGYILPNNVLVYTKLL